MKKTVPVGELQFGMYVAELDRPWTDTPFMFQGFVLEHRAAARSIEKVLPARCSVGRRALEAPDAPLAACARHRSPVSRSSAPVEQ